MRAAIFYEHGGVEKLAVEEVPDPECGADDAVIEIGAASLNGFDPMILGGTTSLKTPLPMIPCGDFAGTIVELGARVRGDWSVGDRVCPHPFVFGEGMTGETRQGVAAQYARIPAMNLIATPDGVSDVEAAALPIAYGTAYRMMYTRGAVKAGETVLILGATGGVGTCCVQLAKAVGATVIATGSADWKLEKLKELGADHVVNTQTDDWVEKVHELCGKPRLLAGGGVDVVINYIGGETWARSLKCLKANGRMLTCGASAGYHPQTDMRFIWTYEQTILGSNGWSPQDQIDVLTLVEQRKLLPVIHATRPLEDIAESMQELIDRKVVGKSIMVPTAQGAL